MQISTFLQNTLTCIKEQPLILEKLLSYDVSSFKSYLESNKIERICFMGCGDSFFVGQFGEFVVRQFCPNIHSFAIEAAEFQYYEKQINTKTLIVAISASGRTIAVHNAVKHFRNKTKHRFLLTDSLSASSNEIFEIIYSTDTGGPYDLPPTKVTVAAMFLLLRLINSIKDSVDPTVNEFIRKLPEITKKILQNAQLEQDLLSVTNDANHLWFIGQGGGAIAAKTGATKIHELNSGRTTFCQLEEFAHHGVLGVDPSDSVILVGNGAPYSKIFAQSMENINVYSFHLNLEEDFPDTPIFEVFFPITHFIPPPETSIQSLHLKKVESNFLSPTKCFIFHNL